MYELSGKDKIHAWLSAHHDPDERLALLRWLPELTGDPEGVALARRRQPGVPVFVAEVPDLACWVTYSVVEQYKAVQILRIDESPALPRHDEDSE